MNRTFPAAVALMLGLTLAGCTSDSTTGASDTSESEMAMQPSTSAMAEDGAMDSQDTAMDSQDSAMESAGAWIDQAAYDADRAKYQAAGDVVLFFNATWCPTCRAVVESLDADGVPAGLTVVSVDFDTATDLRKQHGVTVQHTFVQVDATGEQLAKWTGSESGEAIAAQIA